MDKIKQNLLKALKEGQEKVSYLSQQNLAELAKSLDVSKSDLYGVATFYSFLSTRPRGRNVIRVCKSLPCLIKNSQTIIESIEKEIGIGPGEVTSDNRFSFELTNCIGACDEAPAMIVNQNVHRNLTPDKIKQILKGYK